MVNTIKFLVTLMLAFSPQLAIAAGSSANHMDLTQHTVGFVAIGIFVVAYALVMAEEFLHLRKSKPGILWGSHWFPRF